MNIKVLILVILTIILVNSCSDSNPCKSEFKMLQWQSYEIQKGDSIVTFYEHVMKVLDINVVKSFINDTIITDADTIYTETDTTYIAADTTYVNDTIVVSSSALVRLIFEADTSLNTQILFTPGIYYEHGSQEYGKNYSYIKIYCDEVSEDTSFVKLSVQNTEVYQDCSGW